MVNEERRLSVVIGWDIGGAHLKAARIENGRVMRVVQEPSPLWLGLDRLQSALALVRAELGDADRHAATMTGELADIFPDRRAGVAAIADTLATGLAPAPVAIYAGRRGWLTTDAAARHADDVASANWLASVTLAARYARNALFVDIGSTTTDIVAIEDGQARARGMTDAERLASGELAYTGLTRSFLMALAPRAPFDGAWTTLAFEYFASTADVYRILGTLPDGADQMTTADGRPKTVAASRARLARMIGRDRADASDVAWEALAGWFAEVQLRQIHDAALLVLSRTTLPHDAPVITAGIGVAVVESVAARLGRPTHSFCDVLGVPPGLWNDACAPAIAVALLLDQPSP